MLRKARSNRAFLKLFALGILILSIVILTNSCKTKIILIPVGEIKVIEQLPDGNYVVTQAFVIEFYKMKEQLKEYQ